jgi:hypothetical protein
MLVGEMPHFMQHGSLHCPGLRPYAVEGAKMSASLEPAKGTLFRRKHDHRSYDEYVISASLTHRRFVTQVTQSTGFPSSSLWPFSGAEIVSSNVSLASRMYEAGVGGLPACISASQLDGDAGK